MGVLNAWQKIDRVVSGKPFGDGSDGDYSSSTIPTLTKDSCSGTAASTTLTTSGSTFANDDVLLIHQTRGTGAGQWEINKVASGGGTTSLTLQEALHYTFTDSGASQAQAIKILQYKNVSVSSGTWSVPTWNSNVGGIFVIAVKDTMTLANTIPVNGGAGSKSSTVGGGGGSAGGFVGGGVNFNVNAYCGEGTGGATTIKTTANGNGGGGADHGGGDVAGNGGGHAISGTGGGGGGISGAADLTTMTFGGAGGGCTQDYQPDGAQGGGGSGGIIILIAKNVVTSSALITCNGGSGGTNGRSGGAGAGGSILVVCETGTLGTDKLKALAGSAGIASSVGRIAVHHSGTVTGTTTPTFTDVEDSSLKESGGGFFAIL